MGKVILKNIALHHFGGIKGDPYFSTQHITLDQLNESHKQRWPDFKSTLDSYVGYNFVILPDGKVVQTRALGEETAAQRGFNKDTISICPAGNFNLLYDKSGPVDKPTANQVQALRTLMVKLLDEDYNGLKVLSNTRFDLSLMTIYPHKFFTTTTCYGTSLTDNWGRQLAIDYFHKKIGLIRKLFELYTKLYNWLKKRKFKKIAMGAVSDRDCPGRIDIK